MLRLLAPLASLGFAILILAISIFRSATPDYAFSQPISATPSPYFDSQVEYYFPYPGIYPNNPLWAGKVLRDKVWLFVTQDKMRRAELLLLFADKRVVMVEGLLKDGQSDLAVSTAGKAEKYLEEAYLEEEVVRREGEDTTGFLQKLARASLKHRDKIEKAMSNAPEDAKPVLNTTLDLPKNIYSKSVLHLQETGKMAPIPQKSVKN